MKKNRVNIAGILSLLAGFSMLFFADREALNIVGIISPVLIFAGWIIISAGLWGRDG